MKKVLLSLGVVAALAMTSCGGVDACSCMETSMNMLEEIGEAGGDADKMKEIEEKYKSDIEACEKFMEGLSDEEKEAQEKDLEENCEAYKKMQEEMGMGGH